MRTIEKELNIKPGYDVTLIAKKERIVFFDIETTGLYAESSGLYLIGAVHYEGGTWKLCQWFAETPGDEGQLLSAFFGLLSEKRKAAQAESGPHANVVLVHFNGDHFDIPYLQKLLSQYRLPYSFQGTVSLDLYKKIKPYKDLLKLPNCKLKTVERFFGICREDKYNGGELIYVYEEYLRLQNLDEGSCEYNPQNLALRDHLLKTLLLHNEEDMTNLPLVCGLLAYDDLFRKQYRLRQAEVTEVDGRAYLDLTFALPGGLPKELTLYEAPYCVGVSCTDAGAVLNLAAELYEGELKYFFPDYKNYYYLPFEDYAVHKSVGEFVEKGARRQATARTCYQKKRGRFLPEPVEIFSPVFYEEYKGKTRYAEFTEALCGEEKRLSEYTAAVLSCFLKSAKPKRRSYCF